MTMSVKNNIPMRKTKQLIESLKEQYKFTPVYKHQVAIKLHFCL